MGSEGEIVVTGANSWLESYDEDGHLIHGPTDFQADFVPSRGGTWVEDQDAHYALAMSTRASFTPAVQKFDENLSFVSENPAAFLIDTGTVESNALTSIGDLLYAVDINEDPAVIWEVALDGTLQRTFSLGTVLIGRMWISVSQDDNFLFAASPFTSGNNGVSKTTVATGVSTSLPWNITDDIDPHISSIDEKLVNIYDLRELPGGDLLIMGGQGTWVRVRPSDGTILHLYNTPQWVGLNTLTTALSQDNESFWSGGWGVPSDFGVDNPPGYTSGISGIIVRQNIASGATELAFAVKGIPSQLWLRPVAPPPPVLTLGPPTVRVFSRP
jgi:hypothetical protein